MNPSRLLHALCVAPMLCIACSGAPSTPDGEVGATQSGVCAPKALASDPAGAAMTWASNFETTREGLAPDAATAASDWTGAHVLRVWRDGASWKAIVAGAPKAASGNALVLTIVNQGDAFVVNEVALGSATTLWPSL